MGLWLAKLQELEEKTWKLRVSEEPREGWEKIDRGLHYQGLYFIFKTIQIKPISQYYNEALAGHFGLSKTKELISQHKYWPSLQRDIEAYVKGCNISLAWKQ